MTQSIHPAAGVAFHARSRPQAIAIEDDQRALSYAELVAQVAALRQGLDAAGLRAGARVGVVAKNRAEVLVLILASLSGGPVCVPINRRLPAEEMAWQLQHAKCAAVFADAEAALQLAPHLADTIPETQRYCLDTPPADWASYGAQVDAAAAANAGAALESATADAGRPYLQIYTSGTSGRPKGVVLSEGNALAQLSALLLSVDAALLPGEGMYQALPLFHVGGIFASLWGLSRGLTLRLRADFAPAVALELLADAQTQHAALVPAMIQACLQPPPPQGGFANLKTILYGASPISTAALAAAVDRFACDFLQVYGMSETHSVISILGCADHRRIVAEPDCGLATSAGRAVAGTTLRIRDADGRALGVGEIGEICVASAHVMSGYWQAPEATADALHEGELRTGDAAYLDEQGYVHIVDRLKDIIVTGGENVSSLEVESALAAHPDVADVAVIGTPDARWGETVTALVVPRPGVGIDEAALQTYCKARLGGFRAPRRFELIDEIPRNAGGKILKAALRKRYWEQEMRHVG